MATYAPRAGSGGPAALAGDHPRAGRRGGDLPLGRVFDIKRFAIHDGPGIRSTVFFTGCPLRCAWCHNPEAFALCGPKCEEAGACVRQWTVGGLLRELERDIPYYDRSGGGVTLSGGEPLGQPEFVLELLRACRRHELHSAVDTSGCVDPRVLGQVAALCDLVLYDLKSIDDDVHREWTGVGNTLILENLELLNGLDVETWIRVPLVPGVNDDPDELDAMIGLLRGTRFRRVSILPYHRIAEGKYKRLGLPDRMAKVAPPGEQAVVAVRDRLAAAGFETHIGS